MVIINIIVRQWILSIVQFLSYKHFGLCSSQVKCSFKLIFLSCVSCVTVCSDSQCSLLDGSMTSAINLNNLRSSYNQQEPCLSAIIYKTSATTVFRSMLFLVLASCKEMHKVILFFGVGLICLLNRYIPSGHLNKIDWLFWNKEAQI